MTATRPSASTPLEDKLIVCIEKLEIFLAESQTKKNRRLIEDTILNLREALVEAATVRSIPVVADALGRIEGKAVILG